MSRNILIIGILLITLIVSGCIKKIVEPDIPILSAYSGDEEITLKWTMKNPDTVKIFVSDVINDEFSQIAEVAKNKSEYKVTNLINGKKYYFFILNSKESGSKTIESIPEGIRTPPNIPRNLIAQSSGGRIKLEWDEPESGAKKYCIYLTTQSGVGYIENRITTSTSIQLTGLNEGVKYYFTLKAGNNNGWSEFSNEVSATALTQVNDLKMSIGTGKVNLSWGQVEGATLYKVYSTDGKEALAIPTTKNAIEIKELINGIKYYYAVKPVAENSEGPISPFIDGTPIAIPKVEAISGNGNVNLNWETVPGATSYKIYKSITSQSGYVEESIFTTNTKTITGLTNGVKYYFKVKAINGRGESDDSSEISSIPLDKTSGLEAYAGTGIVSLKWKPIEGASEYKIFYSTTSGNNYLIESTTHTSITLRNLTNGVRYYFAVKGIVEHSEGALSAETSAVPIGVPEATAISGNESVTLNWEAVPGATSYRIYKSTTSENGYIDYIISTTNMMTIDNLKSGIKYYFKIRALNVNGESNYSKEVSTYSDGISPKLNSVRIYSDNILNNYAKEGNIVSLEFKSNEPITTPTAIIAGKAAIINHISGNLNWIASRALEKSETEGDIPFSINYSDFSENEGMVATISTDFSNVKILNDNEKPILTSVKISSSNLNSLYARNGDMIRIDLTANENIVTPTALIAGHIATIIKNVDNLNWTALYNMSNDDNEGDISFEISYRDYLNNEGIAISATTNSTKVIFDKTPPLVPKISGIIEGSYNTNQTFTIEATDLQRVTYTLNGLSWNQYSNPITITSEGAYRIQASEKDEAGNQSNSNIYSIIIDKTAPTGLISINEWENYSYISCTLSLSCNEPDGTMCFSNDGFNFTDWEPFSSTKNWSLMDGNGEKRVFAKFKDKAGNISVVYSDTTNYTKEPIPITYGKYKITTAPSISDVSYTSGYKTSGLLPILYNKNVTATTSSISDINYTSGYITNGLLPILYNKNVTVTTSSISDISYTSGYITNGIQPILYTKSITATIESISDINYIRN